MFQTIAPIVIKELDSVSKNTIYFKDTQMRNKLEGNSAYYIGLIRKEGINSVIGQIEDKYVIYERNIFNNYVIFLIPRCYDEEPNILNEYAYIIKNFDADFFIFSQTSFYRDELINEIKMIDNITKYLSFLEGVFFTDELPLLYTLNYSPIEYKKLLYNLNNVKNKEINSDSSFFDTLRLYLVLRNVNDVSSILNLHVNSVKYRINQCLNTLGYRDNILLGDLPSIKLLLLLELLKLD